jgi:hypothetical protein
MKKIMLTIIVLYSTLILTSCNVLKYANWEQRSKILANNVLNELIDENESDLTVYFCDITLKENNDLDNQILNAQNFLKDAQPVINRISVSGEEWIDYGEYTLISPFVYMEFSDSKSNEEYSMSISLYLINAKYPEKEGISLITIKRMRDEEIINIGESIL